MLQGDTSSSTRASTSKLLAQLRGHKRGARRRHGYSMQQRLRVQLPSLREAYAEKVREKEQEAQRRKDAADRAEAAAAASAASRRDSAGKLLWKRAKRDLGKRMMEKAEIRKLIAGSKVFAETLSPDMVRDLVEDAEQMAVDHGQFLFHQGEPGNGMYLVYIVQSGKVEILRKIDGGEDGDSEGGCSDLSRIYKFESYVGGLGDFWEKKRFFLVFFYSPPFLFNIFS